MERKREKERAGEHRKEETERVAVIPNWIDERVQLLHEMARTSMTAITVQITFIHEFECIRDTTRHVHHFPSENPIFIDNFIYTYCAVTSRAGRHSLLFIYIRLFVYLWMYTPVWMILHNCFANIDLHTWLLLCVFAVCSHLFIRRLFIGNIVMDFHENFLTFNRFIVKLAKNQNSGEKRLDNSYAIFVCFFVFSSRK